MNERIVRDASICHGKPTIKGTRIMVFYVLELLAQGNSVEQVLEEIDYIERADVLACLEYAAYSVQEHPAQLPTVIVAEPVLAHAA